MARRDITASSQNMAKITAGEAVITQLLNERSFFIDIKSDSKKAYLAGGKDPFMTTAYNLYKSLSVYFGDING